MRPGTDANAAVSDLEARIPGVRFSTARDTAGLTFTILDGQRVVMWVLVVVAALICAILIGNVIAFLIRRQRGEKKRETMRTMGFDAKAIRIVYAVQAVLVAVFMIVIGTVVAAVSVLICGAVGIPTGGTQQLFGDSILHPWLGVGDVAITAALMLVALVAANLLAT